MGQGKSAHGDHHDRSSRHESVSKSEKKINFDNIISPNGFLPPELIFSLMNSVDFDTYRSLILTCKLWYETGQTTIYGSNLSLIGANMLKGLWWTEVLSNKFSPKFNFSYVASFQGNKVIVNNHHINPTSYGNYKFYKAGFMVDLTTMTKTSVPYGCFFANDYIVHCLKENNDTYFDWDSLEVLDKNLKSLHKISRKSKAIPPPDNGGWGYASPIETINLFVNQKRDENSILLVNIPFSIDKTEEKLTMEVYDLKTAKMTVERKIEAKNILGYYGNYVIAWHGDKITAYDLNSSKHESLTSDYKNAAFYIYEDEIAVRDKNKIKFISLTAHKETREIDMTPHMKSLPSKGHIRSVAFDKTKIVVGVELGSHIVHYVLGIASGNLLTTLYCRYDKAPYSDPSIYLPPNGKIVIDAYNLTVYDFAHPNANPELKVPIVYIKDSKAQQTSIKLSELNNYAAQKFNTTFAKLKLRTFTQADHPQPVLRITLIYSESEIYRYGEQNVALYALFDGLDADQTKRSAWQLTTNDLQQIIVDEPDHYENDEAVFHTKEAVLLLFERYNSKNNRWEFCEPSINSDKIEWTRQ